MATRRWSITALGGVELALRQIQAAAHVDEACGGRVQVGARRVVAFHGVLRPRVQAVHLGADLVGLGTQTGEVGRAEGEHAQGRGLGGGGQCA